MSPSPKSCIDSLSCDLPVVIRVVTLAGCCQSLYVNLFGHRSWEVRLVLLHVAFNDDILIYFTISCIQNLPISTFAVLLRSS